MKIDVSKRTECTQVIGVTNGIVMLVYLFSAGIIPKRERKKEREREIEREWEGEADFTFIGR